MCFPNGARDKQRDEACGCRFDQIHRTNRKERKTQQRSNDLSNKKSRERDKPIHDQPKPPAPEQHKKREPNQRRDDKREGEGGKSEQERVSGDRWQVSSNERLFLVTCHVLPVTFNDASAQAFVAIIKHGGLSRCNVA